jgi:flagellar basal body-associated protein FliL
VSGRAFDEVGWVSLVALIVVLGVVAMGAGAWVASGHEQRLRDSSGRYSYANAPQHEPVNNCPEEVSWVPVTGTTPSSWHLLLVLLLGCSWLGWE